jgi:hypothetical protein
VLQTRIGATVGAILAIIGSPGVCIAATLNVPGDFATIQACIDAALSGVDECVVAPGTYHETINFLGKAITVRSSGGRDLTTIDATGIGGSVVTCRSGEGPDTVLDGFTITGGTGTESPFFSALGGGMYNGNSSPTVNNCTFRRNTAILVEGGYGGGMLNVGGNPTVTNCAFIQNYSFSGGGMSNYESSPTVTNCTFSGNASDDGGGMHNLDSNPTVKNCTFSGNTAILIGEGYGGGMSNHFGSDPSLTNCIVWGNRDRSGMDESAQIYNDDYHEANRPVVNYSIIQGGWSGLGGIGVLDADPMFVRPPDPGPDGTWDGVDDDYGDLRLRGGSPCIDAGDPGFAAQPGETDLEGHARVLCGRVDMGAYEFGIGDYDCDRLVNLVDFEAWSLCVTGPADGPYGPGCEAFDFDFDGDVDLLDFAGFQTTLRP